MGRGGARIYGHHILSYTGFGGSKAALFEPNEILGGVLWSSFLNARNIWGIYAAMILTSTIFVSFLYIFLI